MGGLLGVIGVVDPAHVGVVFRQVLGAHILPMELIRGERAADSDSTIVIPFFENDLNVVGVHYAGKHVPKQRFPWVADDLEIVPGAYH